MLNVVTPRILHELADAVLLPGGKQQVEVVGYQGPGINGCFSFAKDIFESFKKLIAILIVFKNLAFLDSSDDNVVQRTGSIYAGFTRHVFSLAASRGQCQLIYIFMDVPSYIFFQKGLGCLSARNNGFQKSKKTIEYLLPTAFHRSSAREAR